MGPDLIAVCNEHLPGRDPAENRAIEKHVKAIRRAERALDRIDPSARSTHAGKMRQFERARDQRLQIDDAKAELVVELKRLALEREKLLPPDTSEVTHAHRGADDHSMDRYKVHAITTSGKSVYLGGCANLGEGQDRERWFSELLAARGKQTRRGKQ